MDPTSAQLAARLNPTPVTIQLPGIGQVFSAVGDSQGSSLYVRTPTGLQSLDLQTLGQNLVNQKISATGLVNGQSYKMYDPNGGYTAEYQKAIDAGLGGTINTNASNGTFNVGGNGNFARTYGQQFISDNGISASGSFNLGDVAQQLGQPTAYSGTDYSIFKPASAGAPSSMTLNTGGLPDKDTLIKNLIAGGASQAEAEAIAANEIANGGAVSPGVVPQTPPSPVSQTTSSYTGPSVVDYLNSLGQASDFTSRSQLATEFGITGYTGTAAQNTQLLNSLRLKNAGAAVGDIQQILQNIGPGTGSVNGIPANISSILGTSAPSPTTPINLSDLSGSANSNVDLGGVLGVNGKFTTGNQTIDQLLSMIGAPTADSAAYDALNSSLVEAMKSLGNEGTDYQNLLETSGVNANQKALQELNVEIAGKKGALEKFDAETLATNSKIEDQAIPTGLISGQQAQYQKQRDLTKIAMTADLSASVALAQAYQGNIDLGMKLASDAINLKYSPIENNIKVLQTQIGIAKEKMDKTEQKNTTIIQTLLNMEMDRISAAKDQEKQKQQLIIQAAANGAPTTVISQMQNAPDITTAASIAGQYTKSANASAQTASDKQDVVMKAAGMGVPQNIITQMQNSPDAVSATVIANNYLKSVGSSNTVSTGTGSSSGSGSGTITTPVKFTSTQINNGAANAGINIADFQKLAPDVQNYYINNSTGVKGFNSMLTDLSTGDLTNADALKEIDNNSLPQSVKDYLKQIVNTKYPPSAAPNSTGFLGAVGNFFSNAWNGLLNLF